MHRIVRPRAVRGLALSSLLSLLSTVSSAPAVPFRPDVEARLKTEGVWEEIARGIADARARGLDQPSRTAGALSAGDGLMPVQKYALVILVDFDDNAADEGTYPTSHYEEMLFSVGTYPTKSMRDWYLENSYGNLDVDGVVTVWYRLPEDYSYYVDGQAGFGDYPMNAQKMAEDAVAAADPDVDFSQFDNDGPDGIPDSGDDDGYVDGIFVVHAGPGRETTGSDNDIHSHAWGMSSPQPVDGVLANGYSTEPDDGRIGVFGHEYGHVLGLPDLYDTDGSSAGIGSWGMMSYGSWGGGGLTPVHFIAWCKMQLGITDPIVPESNVAGALVPRAETSATAYKLWTNGLGQNQYFVVENRQWFGFDVELPGAGILIYHIDETASGNFDESHPLVAVEQADGLFELESNQGSDAGDPYPGITNNFDFNAATTPSSNDYDGNPTQVAVAVLTGSQATMEADLTVETEPNVVLKSWYLDDAAGGDGDFLLDPDESAMIGTTLLNVGTSLLGATGVLTEPGGQGLTVTQPNTNYGDLPADAQASGDPPFEISLDAGTVVDAVEVSLDAEGNAGAYSKSQSFYIGVSDALSFFRWPHAVVTPGYVDQWHVSSEKNHTPSGLYSWKFGVPGGDYANSSDGALETVPLTVGVATTLRFWHWIEAEPGEGNEAWDGGILEVSVDGGEWAQIAPVGGYPYEIIPNPASPFAGGTPCFSGFSADWEEVEVDLSGLGDVVQLRWRFGSDGFVTEDGWYIDDVEIEGGGVADAALPDAARPGSAWFAQPAPNPAAAGTRLDFSVPAGGRYDLGIFDLGGRLVRSLDGGVASGRESPRTVTWDGRNGTGAPVVGGLYFARLSVEGAGVWTRKVAVVE